MTTDERVRSVFVCPHCGTDFETVGRSVRCSQGHTFDRAREGHLNLLIAGRLSSGTVPGDTAESLNARRRFLSTGAYEPISDAVNATLGEIDGPALDVGCGEGWYLSRIRSSRRFGLDISKRGVQMASRSMPDAEFVVGNAHRLPVRDGSCDAVFNVFAPHSIAEFQRVLAPGGRWTTVTPGPDHLHQMRPRRNDHILERERRREAPPDHAQSAERLRFDLELSAEQARDLFSMTPLVWQTAADAAPSTSVTVDVWVSSGRT